MNASFIQCVSVTSALTLIFTIGSANAAAYSWTEILIPSIGPLGIAFGPNDKHLRLAIKVSAQGINNGGTIVGGAFSPSDPTHEQGFILIGSKYTFFSRPGWDNTSARAIANSGLITGYSYASDQSTTSGFIYNAGTNTFTDATPPGSGAGFSVTQGMNADGRISGDGRSDELGRYAFVWQQGSLVRGARELAPFLARLKITDAGSAARGINDAGVIVGFNNSGGGFVGSDSRGFQVLVPPGGDAPGASVACEGVNNFRQVACGVTDAAGNTRDFIGTPSANDQ